MKTTNKETPASPAVVLIPTCFFVADTAAAPKGLKAADTRTYVQGLVEETSPFPAEHTAWGYLREPGADTLLYFATWRDKLKAVGDLNDTRSLYYIPEFLILSARSQRQRGWIFLTDAFGLSAVHFSSKSRVPDRIESRYFPTADSKPDPSSMWELRKSILADIDPGDEPVEPGIFRCDGVSVSAGKSLLFQLFHTRAPGEPFESRGQRKLGPEAFIYAADVRNTAFLNRERRKRRTTKILARLAIATCILIVLLLFTQVYTWLQQRKVVQLQEQVATQQPIVDDLQQKEALIGIVQHFRSDPLRPFDWLLAINQDRPLHLSFGSVAIDKDKKTIRISGTAPDVNMVNRYHDAVVEAQQLQNASISGLNSGQNAVDFNLNMEMASLQVPPRAPQAVSAVNETVADAATSDTVNEPQNNPDQ